MSNRVMVGLSGGVDSSVAALLLKEQGFEVTGAYLITMPGGTCDRQKEEAREAAEAIGVGFDAVDVSADFEREVIDPFVRGYMNGITPNPCAVCNPKLKFGAILDYALNRGFDYIATGHYAGVEKKGNRWLLKKAESEKDQSYFLYALSQVQLSKILFPLGGLSKEAVREKAKNYGLPAAGKPDSQEICFIPGNDYVRFVIERAGRLPAGGDFLDKQGNVLGRHRGIIHYTIGQRKGLGAFGSPKFVTGIRPADNAVILGDEEELFSKELTARDMNWIAVEGLTGAIRAQVKTRSRSAAAPATVEPNSGGVHVVFDSPVRSVTPGQAAVLYDGGTVLGGGTIV